jgi:hypothetical protein
MWKRSDPLERRIPSHELKRKRVFPSQWAGQLQSVESAPPPGNEKYDAGLRTALIIEVSSTMRVTSQPAKHRRRRDKTHSLCGALRFDNRSGFRRVRYERAFNLLLKPIIAHRAWSFKKFFFFGNKYTCYFAKTPNLKITIMLSVIRRETLFGFDDVVDNI